MLSEIVTAFIVAAAREYGERHRLEVHSSNTHWRVRYAAMQVIIQGHPKDEVLMVIGASSLWDVRFPKPGRVVIKKAKGW